MQEAPAEPSAEAVRRSKEYEEQYEAFCQAREQLRQEYGDDHWCVFCCGELVGVFDATEKANEAGLRAVSKRDTDVYLVWRLGDMPGV